MPPIVSHGNNRSGSTSSGGGGGGGNGGRRDSLDSLTKRLDNILLPGERSPQPRTTVKTPVVRKQKKSPAKKDTIAESSAERDKTPKVPEYSPFYNKEHWLSAPEIPDSLREMLEEQMPREWISHAAKVLLPKKDAKAALSEACEKVVSDCFAAVYGEASLSSSGDFQVYKLSPPKKSGKYSVSFTELGVFSWPFPPGKSLRRGPPPWSPFRMGGD